MRLALDALCQYRNDIDDMATMRAIESSLNMQLQEERAAASAIQKRLQDELDIKSHHLQAQLDESLAELSSERAYSATVREKLGNALRNAVGNVQILRSENTRLLSKLEEAKAEFDTLWVFANKCAIEHLYDKQGAFAYEIIVPLAGITVGILPSP